MQGSDTVTKLLHDVREGNKQAIDQLIPLVYCELHRLADAYLRRERSDHTLQPTALVNEAYMRLISLQDRQYANRAHFFAVASHLMRQILVDHARGRRAAKRGGGAPKLSLEDALDYSGDTAWQMVALDDALRALEQQDPQKCRLVELKYFGGLTAEETAEVTGMTPQAVYRELRVAQAWLLRELDRDAQKSSAQA